MSWSLAASRLVEALHGGDSECSVAELAFAVAVGEYPDLDVSSCVEVVEGFARGVRARLGRAQGGGGRAGAGAAGGAGESASARAAHEIAALNHVLFERHRFRGDVETYYSPENSFLNRVIERRRGIPLTLSILYIDVGRRAGIPLDGVNFPAHFLVKHTGVTPALVIDPFSCGMILTPEQCGALLEERTDGKIAFTPRLLGSASRRDIAARLLRNLKAYYLRSEDLANALGVMNCLLAIAPDDPGEWRDRGLVRLRLSDSRGALGDFTRFLGMVVPGPETREVEDAVSTLRLMIQRMN